MAGGTVRFRLVNAGACGADVGISQSKVIGTICFKFVRW